jgi:catechol-2,3-dioxygenase
MTQRIAPPAARPISPVKLAHVVLRSRKYQESVRWWMSLLGARVQFENPVITFLTFDEEHHRLAIINAPQLAAPDPQATGVDHFSFTYSDLGDLLSTYERLKDDGVTPYWCINHGPTTSLYYRDPEGNQVELQVDNFSAEQAAAWFHSEAFRANPIGVEFHPDVLVEKFRAGTPVSELVKQGSA